MASATSPIFIITGLLTVTSAPRDPNTLSGPCRPLTRRPSTTRAAIRTFGPEFAPHSGPNVRMGARRRRGEDEEEDDEGGPGTSRLSTP